MKTALTSFENIDAVGVHTGDSFCAAPFMTIDKELENLGVPHFVGRATTGSAIAALRRSLRSLSNGYAAFRIPNAFLLKTFSANTNNFAA